LRRGWKQADGPPYLRYTQKAQFDCFAVFDFKILEKGCVVASRHRSPLPFKRQL
jgi:hypothetical protein